MKPKIFAAPSEVQADALLIVAWINGQMRERGVTWAAVIERLERGYPQQAICVDRITGIKVEAVVAEMLGYASWGKLLEHARIGAALKELTACKNN